MSQYVKNTMLPCDDLDLVGFRETLYVEQTMPLHVNDCAFHSCSSIAFNSFRSALDTKTRQNVIEIGIDSNISVSIKC